MAIRFNGLIGNPTPEEIRLKHNLTINQLNSNITPESILEMIKTVDGHGSTLDADTTDGIHLNGLTATVAELNTLDGITATVAELNYTDGVTSNIQTQLDAAGSSPDQIVDIILAYTPASTTLTTWNKVTGTMYHPAYKQTVTISAYPDSDIVRSPYADYWSATYATPGTYTNHEGLDAYYTSHAPIYAVADGTVYECFVWNAGSGLYGGVASGTYVAIRTTGTVGCTSATVYKHLNSYVVTAGQVVSAGDLIGYQGTTGDSTGEHLHFDLFINSYRYDPVPYLIGAKSWVIGSSPSDLSVYALKANVLELANTTPFTPDADYEPATKKYVDDSIPVTGSFSGTGTATTTFTVIIGQTMGNTTYKVNMTPTSLLGAAVFYINNKTTTTFDVVYLTGLTGTLTFDWSVFT